MIAMLHWGDRHLAEPDGPPMLIRHKRCGGLVDDRGNCEQLRRAAQRPRRLHRVRARRAGRVARAATPRRLRRRLDFELSDEQRLLRDTVRDFARSEVAPVAEELDRTKAFPYELVAKMGELGLMGIPFPEEYGGGGGDSLSYALAVEELTRVDSSVAITMCRPHLARHPAGLPVRLRRAEGASCCPTSAPGGKLGAFGLTEPEAGSDAGNVRTRARLDDGEWVIDGAKQFITNAGHRDLGPRGDHRAHRRRTRSRT